MIIFILGILLAILCFIICILNDVDGMEGVLVPIMVFALVGLVCAYHIATPPINNELTKVQVEPLVVVNGMYVDEHGQFITTSNFRGNIDVPLPLYADKVAPLSIKIVNTQRKTSIWNIRSGKKERTLTLIYTSDVVKNEE